MKRNRFSLYGLGIALVAVLLACNTTGPDDQNNPPSVSITAAQRTNDSGAVDNPAVGSAIALGPDFALRLTLRAQDDRSLVALQVALAAGAITDTVGTSLVDAVAGFIPASITLGGRSDTTLNYTLFVPAITLEEGTYNLQFTVLDGDDQPSSTITQTVTITN